MSLAIRSTPAHTTNPAYVSPNHKKSRKGISLQDHVNLYRYNTVSPLIFSSDREDLFAIFLEAFFAETFDTHQLGLGFRST